MGSTSKYLSVTTLAVPEVKTEIIREQRKFIAPVSPHDLIQEHYASSPWRVLCCCIFLNCTSRTQLNAIVNEFFSRWPDASSVWDGKADAIADVIKSLGFKNRRTDRLKKMSIDYIEWCAVKESGNDPGDIRNLHGVGEYAARSFEIFCEGKLGDVAPDDGPLRKYWQWAVDNTSEYEKGWM